MYTVYKREQKIIPLDWFSAWITESQKADPINIMEVIPGFYGRISYLGGPSITILGEPLMPTIKIVEHLIPTHILEAKNKKR